MKEKKEVEKDKDKEISSPMYRFVSRLGTVTTALMILAMGLDMEKVFRLIILITGVMLSIFALIFSIFERKLTKPGDEFTAKIVRSAESRSFGTFPLFLFMVFMICIICAEASETTLSNYISAGTIIGIVVVSYIAHVFLYGLLIYIPLKKAGKDNGTQDEN